MLCGSVQLELCFFWNELKQVQVYAEFDDLNALAIHWTCKTNYVLYVQGTTNPGNRNPGNGCPLFFEGDVGFD
eukprot:3645005-Amphidinium_carterae.1